MYKFKIDWDGYYQAQRCMFLEWLQMVGHIPPYYWQFFFLVGLNLMIIKLSEEKADQWEFMGKSIMP